MNNQQFLEYIIREKKVPYDTNLIETVLHNYFKSSVELLEKQIDFNYMNVTTSFTVLKNNYYIPIPDNVKKIVTIYDKTHNIELYGDDDVELFYRLFEDKPGIPTKFVYSSNSIYFPVPLKDNTEYVVKYYKYTYTTNLVNLENEHPLIRESFTLISTTVGSFIDKYYNPNSVDSEFVRQLIPVERSVQHQKRKILSTVRFDIERY